MLSTDWRKLVVYTLKYLLIVGLFGLGISAPATAVDALSTEELASHCEHYDKDPAGKDGIFCVRYIQGFIDGAVATDERVTLNVAAEFEEEESFSERAARIRLGSRLERFGPSVYAEYCLGAPVLLAAVVDHVVASLQNQKVTANMPLARDLVYLTLRTDYPCMEESADANA